MYFFNLSVWSRRMLGVLLILAGGAGTMYAVRLARAQVTYQRIKFREPDTALHDLLPAAERAHARYPHNYLLHQWVSETAWYTYGDAALARPWVEQGVAQNPHHLEMRWLQTLLVGMEDPAEAAQRWEAYSDVVFWNRWVLAGRVYWLAYAGQLDEAEHYLEILHKVPGDHRWAVEALEGVQGATQR